jgi:hypothetical protein
MGTRLEEAKLEIEKIYKDNKLVIVFDVMEIINKYTSIEGKQIMEADVDTLQADAIKLCALNFHLGTLASNLEADFTQATNRRKYQEANIWTTTKKNNPDMKLGEVDKVAEEGLSAYRMSEAEAQRSALIMRQAVESVYEVVNMLKKIVERLMYEGQAGKHQA